MAVSIEHNVMRWVGINNFDMEIYYYLNSGIYEFSVNKLKVVIVVHENDELIDFGYMLL